MKIKQKRIATLRQVATSRDNFPRKVIEALKQRVAGFCSRPGCEVQTLGPAEDPLVVVSTGHAAHIHAAASGGPRYDTRMSSSERKGINNGIWLCASCATLIDRDPLAYPAALLYKWRHDAEARAKAMHGRKAPKDTDAIETLTAALTGRTREFIPAAIRNVHLATQNALQAVDDRFDVLTSHVDGATHIYLNAKEPVQFRALVGEDLASQWRAGVGTLEREAREVTLPMNGVRFTGSPLLEQMTEQLDNGARIIISPIGKRAVLKVTSGKPPMSLDDIHGHVFGGQEMFRFEGTLYESLVTFDLTCTIPGSAAGPAQPNLSVRFSFDRWSGVLVTAMAYFDKVFAIVEALSAAESFHACLELEGNPAVRFMHPSVHESVYFQNIRTFVDHYRRVRLLVGFLNVPLFANARHTITVEEQENVAHALKVFEDREMYGAGALAEPPEATILVRDRTVLDLGKSSGFWKITQPRRTITVLGTSIELPPSEILFLNSKVEVVEETPLINMPGVTRVRLRFGFTSTFQCSHRFTE